MEHKNCTLEEHCLALVMGNEKRMVPVAEIKKVIGDNREQLID